jgi:hypothetical protein
MSTLLSDDLPDVLKSVRTRPMFLMRLDVRPLLIVGATAGAFRREHLWLTVLFSPSEAGQAAGREFLTRKHLRQEGRDPEVNDKVSPAQIEAMDKWGVQQEGSYGYLKTIKQPTLVATTRCEVRFAEEFD